VLALSFTGVELLIRKPTSANTANNDAPCGKINRVVPQT